MSSVFKCAFDWAMWMIWSAAWVSSPGGGTFFVNGEGWAVPKSGSQPNRPPQWSVERKTTKPGDQCAPRQGNPGPAMVPQEDCHPSPRVPAKVHHWRLLGSRPGGRPWRPSAEFIRGGGAVVSPKMHPEGGVEFWGPFWGRNILRRFGTKRMLLSPFVFQASDP